MLPAMSTDDVPPVQLEHELSPAVPPYEPKGEREHCMIVCARVCAYVRVYARACGARV